MVIPVYRGAEAESVNSCVKIKLISSLLKHLVSDVLIVVRLGTQDFSLHLYWIHQLCCTGILIERVNFA